MELKRFLFFFQSVCVFMIGLALVILGLFVNNGWVITFGWSFIVFLALESFLFVSSELVRTHADVEVEWNECRGCGTCIKLCPMNVFELQDLSEYKDSKKSVPVRKRNCIQCMACVSSCPTKAIEVKKKQMSLRSQLACPKARGTP
jgi:NAD-dependent dihydropyrimidine dehydrogenase PreA subunit